MRLAATVGCACFFVASVALAARLSRLAVEAVEVGPGITAPSTGGLLVLETPQGIPENLAHAKLTIRLLVDKSGRVRSVEPVDPPDPRLGAAAVQSLKNGEFYPAMRDKKPVVVWFNKKVVFRPRAEFDAEIPSPNCVPAADGEVIGDAAPELFEDVELPRLLEKAEPVYPQELILDRVEGQARFACVIDTCGRVGGCRVVDASRGAFARSGLEAVVRRRYVPARRDGKPVAIRFTIAVYFHAR
jgi:TonB family protein